MAKQGKHSRIDVEAHMVHGKQLEWDETEVSISGVRYARAINYYNYHYGSAEAKKFILEYYKNLGNKEMVKHVKKFDELKVTNGIGWTCDMINNGANIVDERGTFTKRLEDMENNPEKYYKDSSPVVKEDKPDKRKTSPREKMARFTKEYVGEIEAIFDEFLQNGCREPRKNCLYEYLDTLKNPYYNYIIEEFEPLIEELKEALAGTDKQLKESYSFLNKHELKRYLKYVRSIKDMSETIKKKRREEKKKEKKKKKTTPKKPKMGVVKSKKEETEGLESFL